MSRKYTYTSYKTWISFRRVSYDDPTKIHQQQVPQPWSHWGPWSLHLHLDISLCVDRCLEIEKRNLPLGRSNKSNLRSMIHWKMDPVKMYFLLEMRIFHCYVSLPKGTFSIHFLQKNPSTHRNHPKIFRPSSLVHFGHDPLSHLSHHRWAQRFGHSLHLFAEGQGVIKRPMDD